MGSPGTTFPWRPIRRQTCREHVQGWNCALPRTITEDNGERIIRPADPYVFRVSDGYHELFIKHYYCADYVSEDRTEEASAADNSNSSTESDVPSSEKSMTSSSDRE